MIDGLDYRGRWWLPQFPEKKVSGTLGFTLERGGTLDLDGSLGDKLLTGEDTKEFDIILGISSDNKDITLVNCLVMSHTEYRRLKMDQSTERSSLYVSEVLVGVHFKKLSDIKFRRISVRYSYLDEWVGISGFDVTYQDGGMTVRYDRKNPIESWVTNSCKLSIGFACEGPIFTPAQTEVSIKQRTYISIEYDQERPLGEYLDVLHRIQDFLTLAITEPVYALELRGTTGGHKIELNKQISIDKPVEIYYHHSFISSEKEGFLWFDMLFRFPDIADRFDTFLKNWLQNLEQLKSAVDLYFGCLYNPKMYVDNEFLNTVQALESYHRLKIRNEDLPICDHTRRIEEIIKSAPAEHKSWLEGKLQYSNEPSLRRRLRELLDYYPEIVSQDVDDKKEIVDKAIDTRNYLVHHDPSLKDRSADVDTLIALTRELQVLFQACLLTVVGCGKDMIRGLFQKNRRYRKLVPIRLN